MDNTVSKDKIIEYIYDKFDENNEEIDPILELELMKEENLEILAIHAALNNYIEEKISFENFLSGYRAIDITLSLLLISLLLESHHTVKPKEPYRDKTSEMVRGKKRAEPLKFHKSKLISAKILSESDFFIKWFETDNKFKLILLDKNKLEIKKTIKTKFYLYLDNKEYEIPLTFNDGICFINISPNNTVTLKSINDIKISIREGDKNV